MYRALLLFLIVLLSHTTQAQEETFSRVRINMHGKDIRSLAHLGLEVEHGVFVPNFYFINEFSQSELDILTKNGFSYAVLIPDLKKHFLEENEKADKMLLQLRGGITCSEPTKNALPIPQNYRYGQMGGYFTYEEMLSILDSMRLLYPNLISTRQNAPDSVRSVEGRPIQWLRLSDNPDRDENEPEILFTALHHAREPNSLSQLIYLMWYLLENYDKDPSVKYLIDNTELYIMPCVNPDGYIYNQITNPEGGGFWRKNRRVNVDNTFGVDLNRNYDYKWGGDDIGSSPIPNAATYRGLNAFSEPEIRAVRYLCQQHQFKMAINNHTYSNVFIYPNNYNVVNSQDSLIFLNFAQLATVENNFKYGNSVQTVGYTVNGASDEWMYGDNQVKPRIYSFTPEIGPSQFGFWPPKSEILNLNQSTLHLNLKALNYLLNYTLITDKTSAYLESKTGKIALNLKRVGLKDGTITVSLKPISSNITSFSAAKVFNLSQNQTLNTDFDYVLKDIVKNGDKVVFAVTVNNGLTTTSDTIQKTYGTAKKIIFKETGDNITQWTNPLNIWKTTTARYVSAPTSITDSPNGNYSRNVNSILVQSKALLVPGGSFQANLQFSAQWELEYDKDYVQLLISTDGFNFQPLCGQFTRMATTGTAKDQPIYDGTMPNWVQENIDLTPYIGKNIQLQFKIVTNETNQFDGFYFDDLDVSIVSSIGTSTLFLDEDDFILHQNKPNPTEGVTQIDFNINTGEKKDLELLVSDISGKILVKKAVQNADNQNIMLNTEGWQSGIYFYWIVIDGKRSPAKKLVKM